MFRSRGEGRRVVCAGIHIDSQNMQNMRRSLARAIGLGSAKARVGAWWAERVSAVALVPLTLWFAASIIVHAGSNYATFIA